MKTILNITFILLTIRSLVVAYDLAGFVTGENVGDQFGSAICTIDFNGDGYSDLVVSAPAADDAGSSSGKVYVFFGGPSADTIADLTLVGDSSSFFGKALASAGDFNNDGYEDLLVGAPFYDLPSTSTGAVYLYYGGPTADTVVDHLFQGENGGDYFGISVTSAGDFNNDGFDDFAAGAYYNDWGGFTKSGKVYLYYGRSSPDFIADRILVGSSDGERFGYAITSGDFDADSISDIAVGAYSYDGAFLNQGRIYIFSGQTTPDTIADYSITGDSAGYKFGWALTSGRVFGQTYADLIMGTDGFSNNNFATGQAFVFAGGPGFDSLPDFSYDLGRLADDYVGFSVTSGVDINGDGADELIAGMPGNDDGSVNAGGAVSFSGGISISIDTTFLGDSVEEQEGNSVGIWKGYGTPDNYMIVLGAPGFDSYRGRVRLYLYSSGSAGCCQVRGDVDHSGKVDVSDLTYLVSFIFGGGTPPVCSVEGDINASGGSPAIDIADLTYLVGFMFQSGPPPPVC